MLGYNARYLLGVVLELLNLQLYSIKYDVSVKGIIWDLTPESDPGAPILPSHKTFMHTTHTCIMCQGEVHKTAELF